MQAIRPNVVYRCIDGYYVSTAHWEWRKKKYAKGPCIDRMSRYQLERSFLKSYKAAIRLKKENTKLKEEILKLSLKVAELHMSLSLRKKH
jgi:hypothetical protein